MRNPTSEEASVARAMLQVLVRKYNMQPLDGPFEVLMKPRPVDLQDLAETAIRALYGRVRGAWSQEITDAMVAAYAATCARHGHREALFAVVNAFIDIASPEET